MENTERQRELWRSAMMKLYQKTEDWPVEDKTEWILLSIDEIHQLFLIARQEALLELYGRFNIKPKDSRIDRD